MAKHQCTTRPEHGASSRVRFASRRLTAWRSTLLLSCLPALSGAAFQTEDVIVVGRNSVLKPGLWEMVKSPPRSAGGTRSDAADRKWRVCVPPDQAKDAPHRIVDSIRASEGFVRCSALRSRLKGNRISGSRSCDAPSMSWRYSYSGTITSSSLVVVERTTAELRTGGSADGQSRVTGSLIGECDGSKPSVAEREPYRADTASESPLPSDRARVPPQTQPTSSLKPSEVSDTGKLGRRPAAVEAVAQPAAPAEPRSEQDDPMAADIETAPSSPKDIVVVARNFEKMKLSFVRRGFGRINCVIDQSSGDAKIDATGCQVLQQCIMRGDSEIRRLLPCINQRMNEIYPRPPADPE